jgi:hypothetical protein
MRFLHHAGFESIETAQITLEVLEKLIPSE